MLPPWPINSLITNTHIYISSRMIKKKKKKKKNASVLPLGNFITDATVRPSHGRLSSHRPTILSSVRHRPRHNPGRWSSTFNTGMELCWSDRALDGPVEGCSCEAVPEEFQMGPQDAARFWEAPQDACIVELWVPWHIGSSLSVLPWRCCNFAGSGGVGATLPHPWNARNTFSFTFLQSLTLLSHAPVLGMYPRWLNILEFFFVKSSPQTRHCTLVLFCKSTYQGV
jgi:hypothetical protein